MGTWGIRTFENDDAADWIADFAETPERSRLARALEPVEQARGEAGTEAGVDACRIALAAAEVVAAWCGRAAPELPPQVTAWLLGRADAVTGRILERTRAVVDAVLEGSPLAREWEGTDEREAWHGAVEDLRRRLGFDGSLA